MCFCGLLFKTGRDVHGVDWWRGVAAYLERGMRMFNLSRFLFCGSFIALVSTRGPCQTKEIDIADALTHYRESLSYLRSVSLRAVVTVHSTAGERELFPQTLDFVFRHDRDTHRAEWLGRLLIYGEDGKIDPRNSMVIKDIADGHMLASLEYDRLAAETDRSRRIMLWYNYEERLKHLYENPNYGGPLFGAMYGSSHKTVAGLFEASPDLHVRRERENINGVPCLVLEGTSPYGKATAWIAPDKGHSAMKWTIEKDPHHLFDDTVLSHKWPGLERSQATFEVKETQEVAAEGSTTFAPAAAVFTHLVSHNGITDVDTYEYTVTDIQPNPDFAALGAFKMDLPDGVRVFDQQAPGIRFQWENGRPEAIIDQSFLSDLDREIAVLKNDAHVESGESPVKPSQTTVNEPPTPVGLSQAPVANARRTRPYVWVAVVVAVAIGWLVLRWRRP
jgi:hypothetical protein